MRQNRRSPRVRLDSVLMVLAVVALVQVAAVRAAGEPAATADGAHAASVDTARQMLARQDYDNALTTLETVLDTQPDNSEARFLKGLALARSGKIDDALKLFESLADAYPGMAEIWNNIGVLRARKDDFAGARKALHKATALDPEHVAAQQNLGDVYLVLARRAYRNVSALAPGNRAVETKIGVLARLIGGRTDDASSAAHAGVSETPEPTRVASVGVPEIVASPPAPATAAAPAVEADKSDPPAAQAQAAVRAALQHWAQAWSTQDLDAYFAAYSDDFDPRGTRTIQQWRALRVRRVRRPDTISVKLSRIDVDMTGPDTATVRFDQTYRSNLYQDRERKTVTMRQGPNGWVITTES